MTSDFPDFLLRSFFSERKIGASVKTSVTTAAMFLLLAINLENLDETFFQVVVPSIKTGVGKVRPAGQIRPADPCCLARGVANSTIARYFQGKNQTWSFC